MKKLRIGLLLVIALSLSGCGTISRMLVPAAAPAVAPATEVTPESAQVVAMKKSVIAAHDGFYVPAMKILAGLRDENVPAIVKAWPKIQAASVKYVELKKLATTLIDTMGAAADQQVTQLVVQIYERIAEIQTARSNAGGEK